MRSPPSRPRLRCSGAARPRRRIGQALVELAVILPFIVVWAAGVLDIGLLAWVHIELTGAAQEVTKVASFNDHTPAQLESLFSAHITVAGTSALSVTTSASDAALGGRPSALIEMSHTFPPVGLASIFRTGDITLRQVSRTPVLTSSGTMSGLVPD